MPEGSELIIMAAEPTAELIATGGYSGAGIGGYYQAVAGHIIINSGIIKAKGGFSCAGIGGGRGSITINGGTIEAVGGDKEQELVVDQEQMAAELSLVTEL